MAFIFRIYLSFILKKEEYYGIISFRENRGGTVELTRLWIEQDNTDYTVTFRNIENFKILMGIMTNQMNFDIPSQPSEARAMAAMPVNILTLAGASRVIKLVDAFNTDRVVSITYVNKQTVKINSTVHGVCVFIYGIY